MVFDNKITRTLLSYLPRPVVAIIVIVFLLVASIVIPVLGYLLRVVTNIQIRENTLLAMHVIGDYVLGFVVIVGLISIFGAVHTVYEIVDSNLPSRKSKDD